MVLHDDDFNINIWIDNSMAWAWYSLYDSVELVIVPSDNDLLPVQAKALPESVLTNRESDDLD